VFEGINSFSSSGTRGEGRKRPRIEGKGIQVQE